MIFRGFSGAPAGTRTPDTLLKRQVLYLLSYWGGWLGWRDSNPLYRSQSPVCYHYTTSQYFCEKGRRRRPFRNLWGGIWGSNPRHPEPQSGALPTELIPPNFELFPCSPRMTKSKPGEAGSIWRRKKEPADMELSRRLRKPRKRNAAGFF